METVSFQKVDCQKGLEPGASEPADDDDVVIPVNQEFVLHFDKPILLAVLQVPVGQNECLPVYE